MVEGTSEELKDRNFITALARGLDVLRCFREGDTALSNTDLSKRTGLPKATVSRLTHTLCKLDYLEVDNRTGTYRLSAGVMLLGFGVLASLDIAERARREMLKLRNGPNSYVVVALGERHGMNAVYLATETSREQVSLVARVGTGLPLFRSAMGRAILTAMDEDERAQAFETARTQDSDTEEFRQSSFNTAQEEMDRLGFCTGYGDWRPDVNGISVAFRSVIDNRVFGLNVGGPSFHLTPKELETVYGPMLVEAGKNLSLA
ncbi:IclR family transcriptional regulator [Ruegeria sp. HKCCA5491]|uniref:IclR family transcriptional regulator n=1 Tax=Ruegeria sp. HKCCA5491 TaxID=2682986 RepID=UPI0014892CEA|nr:IclR family transcriptional regulator [Ruegeria sp. HKCCA5491]